MKVTQRFWVVADREEWHTETSYRLLNWNPEGVAGYCLVNTEGQEITFEVDENFDIRACQAEQLRGQIEVVKARAENAITELTRKLHNLLAIEG